MANDGGFTAERTRWLEQVATDASLPGASYRVAILLAGYMNRKTGKAYPSVETLALRLNTDRRTVQRALRGLTETGHLTVSIGTGRKHSNRYRWNIIGRKGGNSDALCDPEKGGKTAALLEGERAANRDAKGRQIVSRKGGEFAARTREGTREDGEGPPGPSPLPPSKVTTRVEGEQETIAPTSDVRGSGRARPRETTEEEISDTLVKLAAIDGGDTPQDVTEHLRRLLAIRKPGDLVAAFRRQHAGDEDIPFGCNLQQWLSREAAI